MATGTEPKEAAAAQPTCRYAVAQSDLRKTAGQDSHLAALLAGFAFTAVILVMQQAQGGVAQNYPDLANQATASFLIAFLSCLVSATIYAVVASDVALDARPRGTFFLTSVVAFVGGSHVFFGLCCLTAIYLPHLAYLSRWVLILGSVFGTGHLLNVELGLAQYHDPVPHTRKRLALLAGPSVAALGIAIILSLAHAVNADAVRTAGFSIVATCSMLCIALSAAWAMLVNGKQAAYRLPARATAGWTLTAALVFSFLILMT